MNIPSKYIVLHTFLQQYDAGSLLHYLPPSEKEILENLSVKKEASFEGLSSIEERVNRIHPSWIAPFLRTLSKKEMGLFLAALNEKQVEFLNKALLHSSPHFPLSPLGKAYFQKTLFDYLSQDNNDLLPLSFLPTSPLNELLNLSFSSLNQLIDLLGIHDLAAEVLQIIEKSKLQKIYSALIPIQLRYLKIRLQKKEPVTFTRIGVNRWDEDQEQLKLLIQQRGINRLAKALYEQNSSFIWYLIHQFDVEQALLIKKLNLPLENKQIVRHLIQQIQETLTFMKEHHE